MMMDATTTYKEAKEAFVAGHEGTTSGELLLLCASVPIGWATYGQLPRGGLVEILTLWLPLLLCQTKVQWGFACLAVEVLLVVVGRLWYPKPTSRPSPDTATRTALTLYRSGLMLLTVTAILAVDFRVFPRRFCKTETMGYSLMDLGAASTLVAAGLVSSRARSHSKPLSWRRLTPLLFLGGARYVTHQAVDYPEHATEYGVQWNFYLTLFVVSVVGHLVRGPRLVLAVGTASLYQFVGLDFLQGQTWIEEAPRTCLASSSSGCQDWFVANREGVLGCLGYLSLYWASEWMAQRTLWNPACQSKAQSLGKMAAVCMFLWQGLEALGWKVSRRTTNMPFLLWILVVNTSLLAALLWISSLTSSQPPPLLSAINRHGLFVFVIANLLTGVVNLSMNTLEASDAVALVILSVYLGAVAGVAQGLDWVFPRIKPKVA